MKIASWIVTSHHRPELLDATLGHLRCAEWPVDWQAEIVVAHAANDRLSAEVAHRHGCVVVPTREPNPSGKRNAALRESIGELILTTDDDDFQSYRRPSLAVAAYEGGWKVSGTREFRRLHLASGNVVRYCGQGTDGPPIPGMPSIPPVQCGTARNYSRALLEKHHGWQANLKVLEDHELNQRIKRRRSEAPGVKEYDFGDSIADDTIVCQHDKNLCPRPDLPKGRREVFGDYVVIGEGHWSEAINFPQIVAQRLIEVGKL